ncbi:unnamed protein product [Miscanthus lutarioriparius]|uniref:Uncharacterized protein n=1 Tax=Miscanthus lutarioriparius TaxID=422564 RepID=A0A811QLP8_9POAL|nr:unnamed protein product [Miscanthus lutarioriparius]
MASAWRGEQRYNREREGEQQATSRLLSTHSSRSILSLPNIASPPQYQSSSPAHARVEAARELCYGRQDPWPQGQPVRATGTCPKQEMREVELGADADAAAYGLGSCRWEAWERRRSTRVAQARPRRRGGRRRCPTAGAAEKVCYAVVEDEGRCVFSGMEDDEGRGMAEGAVEGLERAHEEVSRRQH